MRHLFLHFSILYLLTGFSHLAMANPADKGNEIHIMADSVQLNQIHNWISYTGHVAIQQTNMQLHADKVIAQYNTHHQLISMTALGKPAHFQWQDTYHTTPLITEADLILYQPQAKKLRLKGHALAQQGANKFASPLLQYDIDKRILLSPATKEGRTTITIQENNSVKK